MVLMKPIQPAPLNEVHFMVPVRMTKWDVRSYLENIYKIPVEGIKTIVKCGKVYRHPAENLLVKDEDWRLAIVTLPSGHTFNFPNLFQATKMDQEMKEYKLMEKKMAKHMAELSKKGSADERRDVPPWFSI